MSSERGDYSKQHVSKSSYPESWIGSVPISEPMNKNKLDQFNPVLEQNGIEKANEDELTVISKAEMFIIFFFSALTTLCASFVLFSFGVSITLVFLFYLLSCPVFLTILLGALMFTRRSNVSSNEID